MSESQPVEDSPALAAPEPSPPRERLRGGAVAWIVAALLVLVLLASAPFWAPPLAALLPWAPPAERDTVVALARLEQRLAAIQQQQSALEKRLAQAEQQPPRAAPDPQLQANLRELGTRLTAVEQAQKSAPEPAAAAPAAPSIDPAQLAALQQGLDKLASQATANGERLAKLEARDSRTGGAIGEEALLLALGQLRAQLETSRPYAAELATVTNLSRAEPELGEALKPLAARAQKGLPSTAVLAQRFTQELAPAVMRASAAPKGEDWEDRLWARLRGLVVIRRVGSAGAQSSDPIEAALAKGEAALAGHDLAGAVAAVEALPKPLPAPAQAWLQDAQTRLADEDALSRATQQVTARLAAHGTER